MIKSKVNQFKLAFTLAEILIALTIIGIIAAFTIPQLLLAIETSKNKEILKADYSLISQAVMRINDDWQGMGYLSNNMTPSKYSSSATYGISLSNPGEYPIIVLAQYLPIVKYCVDPSWPTFSAPWIDRNNVNYVGINNECWVPNPLTGNNLTLKLTSSTSTGAIWIDQRETAAILSNGSFIRVTNVYSTIYIDVNGLKKPNMYGVDIFDFNVQMADTKGYAKVVPSVTTINLLQK